MVNGYYGCLGVWKEPYERSEAERSGVEACVWPHRNECVQVSIHARRSTQQAGRQAVSPATALPAQWAYEWSGHEAEVEAMAGPPAGAPSPKTDSYGPHLWMSDLSQERWRLSPRRGAIPQGDQTATW